MHFLFLPKLKYLGLIMIICQISWSQLILIYFFPTFARSIFLLARDFPAPFAMRAVRVLAVIRRAESAVALF